MSRNLQIVAAIALVAFLVGAPLYYAQYRRTDMRNFRIVKDGVLYRSGQMTQAGLKRVIHDYGIKSVVTLRYADNPGETPPDQAEEDFCRSQGIRYFRVKPRRFYSEKGGDGVPADIGVEKFVNIMADPDNHPVLLHCFAGVHRTGTYVAIYRMEFEGWSNDRALQELRDLGYDNLYKEWDVRGYLEQYKPTIYPLFFSTTLNNEDCSVRCLGGETRVIYSKSTGKKHK